MKKRILIFIVTYNSSFRVLNIIKKIRKLNLNNKYYKILIADDCSTDDTVNFIRKIKKSKIIKIIINKSNLGYGGNIIKCLKYALKKKFNYAIMIHGDDQYDAKYIPKIINEFRNKNISLVTGSRMISKKDALKGDMPIYKFLGNIVLTKMFNLLSNTKFTDCHTGLWGYNLKVFKSVKLNKIDKGYNFDNHLRIIASNRKFKINEIPIKTYYRSEASKFHIFYSLNFFKYLIINLINKQ